MERNAKLTAGQRIAKGIGIGFGILAALLAVILLALNLLTPLVFNGFFGNVTCYCVNSHLISVRSVIILLRTGISCVHILESLFSDIAVRVLNRIV